MDKQEIFNTVARHLLAQGVRAEQRGPHSTMCAYRGQGCTKCAAGVLIPDNEYEPRFEGLSVRALLQDPEGCTHDSDKGRAYEAFEAMWARIGLAEHLPFIGELQGIHDLDAIEDWRRRLLRLATQHNLNAHVVADPL